MQYSSGAFSDCGQRVIGDIDRESGLIGDQSVDSAEQGPAAGNYNAAVDEVS